MLFSGALRLPGHILLLQTSMPLLKLFSWSKRPFSSPCSHLSSPLPSPSSWQQRLTSKLNPMLIFSKTLILIQGEMFSSSFAATTNTSWQTGVLPEEYSLPSPAFLSPPLPSSRLPLWEECLALSHGLGHITRFGSGMLRPGAPVTHLPWRHLPGGLWAKKNEQTHVKQIWTQSTGSTQVQSTQSLKQSCSSRPLGPWAGKN